MPDASISLVGFWGATRAKDTPDSVKPRNGSGVKIKGVRLRGLMGVGIDTVGKSCAGRGVAFGSRSCRCLTRSEMRLGQADAAAGADSSTAATGCAKGEEGGAVLSVRRMEGAGSAGDQGAWAQVSGLRVWLRSDLCGPCEGIAGWRCAARSHEHLAALCNLPRDQDRGGAARAGRSGGCSGKGCRT